VNHPKACRYPTIRVGSASSTPPALLAATANGDPYGFYDRVRAEGEIVRDESVGAWLLTSHALIREVMRQDKVLVRHPAVDSSDATFRVMAGGERSRILMNDDGQSRHHRWFVRRFSYTLVDQWRETLLRPIIDRLLDEVVDRGRIEFLTEYSDRFSVRVIAAVLGLPWDDDAWISYCKHLLDCKQRYVDVVSLGPSEEVARTALEAVAEMDELLLPFILAAKEREPREDDIMALLWAEGRTIMPDWGLEDVQAWVATTFFAGTDTTTHAIENALYLLMTVPGLQDELRRGDFETIERFSEEVLRLFPSVHFISRLANDDFECGGEQIRKDDRLIMLDAGANRDPARFSCPHEIDLTRDAWREHLTFSIGPRTCAGAALARGEVQESVAKALERLPNLRLDPDAEPPRLQGFLLRSYRPLHALFDPPARQTT
jgi:cytochrome P450